MMNADAPRRAVVVAAAAVSAIAASLLGPPSGPAAAQMLTSVEDVVQARLLPGWRTAAGAHMTALRVDLAPGWKTYWRAPGEGGIPPVFDWSRSDNVGAVAIHWPRPVVFDQAGLQSVGYTDLMVLPLELTPRRAGAAITVDANVQIGVCKDICIPVKLDLEAVLSAAGVAEDPLIRAALADRPMTAGEAGLREISCTVAPLSDGLRVSARISLPDTGGPEAVVFEIDDETIWVSEAEVVRRGGVLHAEADLVPAAGRPFALDRSRLRLTVIGTDRAVDLHGCPAP